MKSDYQIIHVTDLFNPPRDPDDHFDLLTLLSVPDLPVAAVITDHAVENRRLLRRSRTKRLEYRSRSCEMEENHELRFADRI